VTRRPRGAKPQVKGAQGPADRPNTLSDGHTPKVVYKSIHCLKVGGDREEWPVGHVDGRLAVHHL
jgi:hypothetical protein